MEQILYAKTYQEYKAEMDTELSKTAERFVRIGYLLKVARDTNVLAESPYQTVTEFAKAEYGIDKTMVSRFISINDRFSEGGYSDQLQEQYKGYGYAKLTLMLSLPDEINQELSPTYSKAEIQAIKDEVDEEKAISDLEVMMEGSQERGTGESVLNMLIRQMGEDSPELYVQMAKTMALKDTEWVRAAKEIMAPNGEKQYSIRISGIGRYLVSIRDTEDTITATSLRTMEKHTYDYLALMAAWEELLPPSNGKMDTALTEKDCRICWELTYDREYPGKAEVAPVQQSEKPKKTESKPPSRKESKVQKAQKPTQAKAEPPVKEKHPTPDPEKPGETGMEAADNETYTNHVRLEETLESTSTEEQTGIEAADNETVTNCHQLKEKSIETGTEQPEKQLPGQIGIEEAIKETEERNGVVSYIDLADNPVMAADQLDKEWEREKVEFLDDLKRLDTEGSLLSRNLSQIPYVHIAAFRTSMINMAALIEKELLRRGKSF